MDKEDFQSFSYFNKVKEHFKKWVADIHITQGSVIKSKMNFIAWQCSPIIPDHFEEGLLFTVVDVISTDNECTLHCLQDNKIVEIDCFVFLINSENIQSYNCRIDETFSSFFDKIL